MSNKANLTLDLIIFGAYLFSASPKTTGNFIHEWLGLALVAAVVLHLLWHWKWISKVTTTFFKKLWHSSRLDYVVDLLFLIAFTIAMFTGIMISKDILGLFGITTNEHSIWREYHHVASDLSVLLLGIHIALHWGWIVQTTKRLIIDPISRIGKREIPAVVLVKTEE